MNRPLSPELQEAFAQFLTQLRQSFGEDLLGVYALAQDRPRVIAVIETFMTSEQAQSLMTAYEETLNPDIGLTIFTVGALQQGHPYEANFSYEQDSHPMAQGDTALSDDDLALTNTTRLRALHQRGYVLAGPMIGQIIPRVSNDDYRVALRREAERRLTKLTTHSTETILHLCRILAFWRIGLVLPIDDVGAWSLKNLDPRFQTLIERASIEYQSGTEPGTYNSYQLDQFAEYVRDMMRR
jgi:hypothetical protein